MPRCACASEVYGSVFVCLCVCVYRPLQLLKDESSASKFCVLSEKEVNKINTDTHTNILLYTLLHTYTHLRDNYSVVFVVLSYYSLCVCVCVCIECCYNTAAQGSMSFYYFYNYRYV